ncbi:MAG: hypothetical protein AABY32_03075 [Nanoarchaeota archaeon]
MVSKKRLKKFNISNKLAYTLIVILSIVLLGIGVYAYNYAPSNPTIMGHTTNEITWPTCSSGQYLTISGGNVVCATPSATNNRYIPTDIKLTTATHNGDFRTTAYGHYNSGYENMNDWIQDNGCSGYHACTLEEVVTHAQVNHAFPAGSYTSGSNTGWVSSGFSVGTVQGTIGRNDCQGWTWPSGNGTAVTIFPNYIVPGSLDCSSLSRVACCK